MNRLITSKETESLIKNLPKEKSSGPDGFPGEFHWIYKEKMDDNPIQTLPKHKVEGTFSGSFWDQFYPDTKTKKGHYRRENYRPL